MKTLSVISVAILVGCVLTLGLARRSFADDDTPFIAANIHIDQTFAPPSNQDVVLVFIPTGSKSINCLTTLNDTTFVVNGTQVFCALRTSPTLGSGVVITIDYFQPVPSDYQTNFTLWQQGAIHYGNALTCTQAGFSFC